MSANQLRFHCDAYYLWILSMKLAFCPLRVLKFWYGSYIFGKFADVCNNSLRHLWLKSCRGPSGARRQDGLSASRLLGYGRYRPNRVGASPTLRLMIWTEPVSEAHEVLDVKTGCQLPSYLDRDCVGASPTLLLRTWTEPVSKALSSWNRRRLTESLTIRSLTGIYTNLILYNRCFNP